MVAGGWWWFCDEANPMAAQWRKIVWVHFCHHLKILMIRYEQTVS